MKVSVCIILALCIMATSAIRPKKVSQAQINQINEIKSGNTWAGILLNLAELHMQAKGPVEELIAAIEDTVKDLGVKRERRDAAFEKRTVEHQTLVKTLENNIVNAQEDIARIDTILEGLAEQKAALQETVKKLRQSIEDIKSDIAEAVRIRAQEHEEYELKAIETVQAIEAVDECLKILNDFAEGKKPALLQIKKAKVSLIETHRKISNLKHVESAFLKALIEVAMNQEFADKGAVIKVTEKFTEIKDNLQASSVKLRADEDNAQVAFQKFLADSKAAIRSDKQAIAENIKALAENVKATQINEDVKLAREGDIIKYTAELKEENDNYAAEKKRYEEYCKENEREIAVCKKALEVVGTLDLADYISGRVNAKDGLVSSGNRKVKQHGQGTEVFKFD